MIRFKCIYCGQRILAKDNGIGKKGHCPKCKHPLVVPDSTKGRPAISFDKEPMPQRSESPIAWGQEDLTDLCKENFGFLIPTYDKLSLLLMAITLILLCLAAPQMKGQILNQMQDLTRFFLTELLHIPEIAILVLLFLAAIFYQIIIFDEKTDIRKKVMLDFAILINTGTGIFAGMYVIQNALTTNWLLVFPVWNIINGILMLLMFIFKIIDEECINDRKTTLVQFFFGLTAIIIIFLFCNYVFKLYWAITFSICIVYTTSFDRALQSVFPRLSNQGEEQPS